MEYSFRLSFPDKFYFPGDIFHEFYFYFLFLTKDVFLKRGN